MPRYGMLIDLDKCMFCQACTMACKSENNIPDGMFWNKVRAVPNGKPYPEYRVTPLPMPCMHCEDAPCVNVCPVSATYHRPDGIVAIDYDKCIGCKYCSWACPYGAREFDEQMRVMTKCTLCVDRIYDRGLPEADRQPACVKACPTGARLFGDVNDPRSPVSRAIAERGGYELMPEWGTRPANRYLPRRSPTAQPESPEPTP